MTASDHPWSNLEIKDSPLRIGILPERAKQRFRELDIGDDVAAVLAPQEVSPSGQHDKPATRRLIGHLDERSDGLRGCGIKDSISEVDFDDSQHSQEVVKLQSMSVAQPIERQDEAVCLLNQSLYIWL
ncbi:hypothetical protein [Prosthecodimorpha staleyi]|uniref:Uncharacterized protein n=1 Tax=Prosthecodimorpha staleyi TaxID=2840188 RepID=A0A947DA27_9HYPH|nr:hypothetical protein [Prosthecodimorpha staleyi]MBT9292631.1 hypothetical protein [Prosthecodimorpha staleyi]